MPLIKIETRIHAPIETCFDLARSIDLHLLTSKTKEEAIAGRTSGLIALGESVTWRARHLGVKQKLTTKISVFRPPFHFRDEQVKGAFRSMQHDHFFELEKEGVLMTDVFAFESPLGFAGRLFNFLVLTAYMRRFLLRRNAMIKEFAESGKWKSILKEELL